MMAGMPSVEFDDAKVASQRCTASFLPLGREFKTRVLSPAVPLALPLTAGTCARRYRCPSLREQRAGAGSRSQAAQAVGQTKPVAASARLSDVGKPASLARTPCFLEGAASQGGSTMTDRSWSYRPGLPQ